MRSLASPAASSSLNSRAMSATGRQGGAEHQRKRECGLRVGPFPSEVLEPLARGGSTGSFCCWVTESPRWRERQCVLVPRPSLHVVDGRLHRTDGPAVEWSNGLSYWFWEGLAHPRRIAAKNGERARLQVLVRTPNLERQGFCSTGSATNAFSISPMRASSSRTTTASSGEPRSPSTVSNSAVVEVVNSTPEADGSHRRYFLGCRLHGRYGAGGGRLDFRVRVGRATTTSRCKREPGPRPSDPRVRLVSASPPEFLKCEEDGLASKEDRASPTSGRRPVSRSVTEAGRATGSGKFERRV